MCIGGGDFDARLSEIVVPRFIRSCSVGAKKAKISHVCVNLMIDIVVDGVLIEGNKIVAVTPRYVL